VNGTVKATSFIGDSTGNAATATNLTGGNKTINGTLTVTGGVTVTGVVSQSGNDFIIGGKRALVRDVGGKKLMINYAGDFANGTYIYKGLEVATTVKADSFNASSDSRVKTDIVQLKPATALVQITQLEPTTYRFITDSTHKTHHGLIAQSVEQVLPTAVNGKGKQFIPSVYRACPVATDKHTIHIPEDILLSGTRLQVTDCSGGTHDITMEIGEDHMVVCEEDLTPWLDLGGNVFVHGHEISDFRSIDYNQVMVVNVAATKCLARELEETRAELSDTKASLAETRTEVAELKAMVQAMINRGC